MRGNLDAPYALPGLLQLLGIVHRVVTLFCTVISGALHSIFYKPPTSLLTHHPMIQPTTSDQTDLTADTSTKKTCSKAEKSKDSDNGVREARIQDFGLRAPTETGKNFVIDTNVVLHDPECLGRFKDNHICIPADVLAELDKFKGEQSERGANARRVHRRLTEMFSSGEEVTRGVPTPGGGTIRLVIYDPDFCQKNSKELSQFLRVFPDRGQVDHRILAATVLLKEHNSARVVLVTKDLNMQLKAKAVGINCEDYLNDKVDPIEVSSYDMCLSVQF